MITWQLIADAGTGTAAAAAAAKSVITIVVAMTTVICVMCLSNDFRLITGW